MTDMFSKKERSYIMSQIRSKWTLQENKVHNFLKARKIEHKMHPKILGKPDIILSDKLLVFLDSCFWHGCEKHCRMPKSGKKYWVKKIENNKKRDVYVSKELKKHGYRIVRIWEHNLKRENYQKILEKRMKLKKS